MPQFNILIQSEVGGVLGSNAQTTLTILGSSTVYNTNYVLSSAANQSRILVLIELAGYYSYSQEFQIYSEDVEIDIRLVPSNDDRAYSHFVSIWQPCTFQYDFYYATSGLWHMINWSIDGVAKSTGPIFTTCLSIGWHDIEQEVQIFEDPAYCGTSSAVIYSADTSTESILVIDFRPQVSFSVVPQSSCEDECPDCFPVDSLFSLVPIFNWNNPSLDYPCAQNSFKWEIISSDGSIWFTASANYFLAALPSQNDLMLLASNSGAFTTITEFGQYTIRATITNCCASCIYEQVIFVCDDVKIVKLDTCHEYKFLNCRGSSVSIDLKDSDGNSLLPGIVEVSGTEYLFTTPGDGIYFIEVVGDPDPYRLIIDLCDIRTCYLAQVKNLLCDCHCKRCSDPVIECQKRKILTNFMVVFHQIQAAIHKQFKENYFYENFMVDGELIPEFKSIQNAIEILEEYCNCLKELECEESNCSKC